MKRRTVLTTLGAVGLVQAIGTGKACAMTNAAPTTADGFTQLLQDKNDWLWSGGDQTTTFKHNGYTYWIFGDTIQSNGETPHGGYPAGWRMIANSILLQNGSQFSNAIVDAVDGAPAVPYPATRTISNNERYWTQGAFYANNHIYVLCQRVKHEEGGLGFANIGGEIAKFKPRADGKLTFVGMVMTPATGKPEIPGPHGIQWCSDAIRAGDYIYIYGATRAEGNPFVLHFSYVSRVLISQLENPMAWRFYKNKTGQWVNSIEQLNSDATNQPDAIVESQLSSVRWIDGRHVMVHKPWNGWGNAVKATYAPHPYGPWTGEHTIFESPEGVFEGVPYETYGPQLHPTQTLASGKTLVSINYNFKNADLNTIGTNADLYKARFFEVQF